MTADKRRSSTLDSVSRALALLELLASQGGSGRVTDLAREIGCSKNTVFRLLQTLQDRDYVRQADDLSYEVTFKLLNLGECVVRSTDLHMIARPFLESLAEKFSVTASIAIMDGTEVVYLDRVLGRMPYHTAFPVGSRAEAYSTSLGKAILAYGPEELVEKVISRGFKPLTVNTITDAQSLRVELQTTSGRGYSVDNQENVLGIRCIGAPIFDRKACPVAAISVSDLAVRITDDRVGDLAAGLLAAGKAISARLGHRSGYGSAVAATASGTVLPLSGVASAGQVSDVHLL